MNGWLMGSALSWGMKSMASGFLKSAEQAHQTYQATLGEIIRRNGAAEWGRLHGLNGPQALGAFRELPVTTYADYAPYIERVANGEQGVLTGDPVTYFAVTSGTTGPQKLIPVTRRQTRAIMSTMMAPIGLALQAGLIPRIRGRYLQIMTEQVTGTTPGGIPKGAATSGGLKSMGKMMERIWTSPMPVIQVQDQRTSRYLHLLFALGEERLWAITAFFPSTLLAVFRDLQGQAPRLLKDLADGTITGDLDLPAEMLASLRQMRRPMPERARQLARLLEQDRFAVKAIWPEVGAIFTAGSGTFRFYVDQLEPFLGNVPVLSPVYASSEASIGMGIPGREGYVTAPAAAYHEFLPVGGDRPVSALDVELGAEYEVLLTTFAGLWRYRLGDLVRVVGRQGRAPVIEFIQRKGQVINLVGEKTSEAQIATAFEAACRALGARLTDYVVTPDPDASPSRYLLLVEAQGDDADVPRLLEAFDRRLAETAPSYGESLQMGELAPMGVLVLQPGTFERYREVRVAAGASASQVKVPHVVPDPAAARRHFFPEASPGLGQ
jgi:hypothetical protein